jgi:hypothetical protein
MRARLRCQVSPGLFSSECAVIVTASSGKQLSLFTDRSTVSVSQWPQDDQTVDGWIDVELVEERGVSPDAPLVLVLLPQTTLENGPYLTVNRGHLDVPRPQTATVPA